MNVDDPDAGDYGDHPDDVDRARINAMDREEVEDLEPPMAVQMVARDLADYDLLTYQQALVYVLRDVEEIYRPTTAAMLDLSESTVDSHLSAARKKVDAAQESIRLLDWYSGNL